MSRKNSGRMVELKDGRTGLLFNEDCKSLNPQFNGKVPVYIFEKAQGALFDDLPPTPKSIEKEHATARVLVDPKELKVYGMFD